MTQESFVDFQNVWLAYNDELLAENHFAVEDINLQVKQGEFIAIVGPSGCGKSTFMKLTTGLKMPSKGRIQVGADQQVGRAAERAVFQVHIADFGLQGGIAVQLAIALDVRVLRHKQVTRQTHLAG